MRTKIKLLRALGRFIQRDQIILDSMTNERSMTHRFAVQVERMFPGYHVDCEHNRKGRSPKRLETFRRRVRSDDTKGVTVYPDIIVHRRGTNDNHLVITRENYVQVLRYIENQNLNNGVILMNRSTAKEFLKFDRSELGGDLAEKLFTQGLTALVDATIMSRSSAKSRITA